MSAVVVYGTARADRSWLKSGGRAIMALDIAWVTLSVVAVAAGWLNLFGNVLFLLVAAVVGGFAVGEWLGLTHLRTGVEAGAAASHT